MADWFKFYENDLDEMRLQWAIGEMPEVLNVWIVLLSEACRHKDGTLSGYNDDFELFAISKRLNITPPLVNKALSLLVKINYVERQEDGSLFIRKWMERQSEYCQKRTKIQNQTGENHWTKQDRTKNNGKELDSVPIVSGQDPDSVGQEERRGDKIREYKKGFVKPTPSEVKEYGNSINFVIDGEHFCEYYETRGWKLSGGVSMKNWKSAVVTWKKSEEKRKPKRYESNI